jgi:tRNA G18 (ribose-2'-O)-methylase SpoU
LEVIAGAPRVLALEAVGNPDNVGGLFRVASALGAGGILLDDSCADPFYRKAIRTSMGASLRVPFVSAADWMPSLEGLRTRGHTLVALTPGTDAIALDEWRPAAATRLTLLLGSEGSGLRPATLALADVFLRIPMDRAADSLNVVVAAAIALRELRDTGG